MKKLIPLVSITIVLIILAVLWAILGKSILSWYYTRQAEISIREDRVDRAVLMLEKQLELYPSDDTVRMKLVELLINSGIPSRAEYHLSRGFEEASQPMPIYKKLCYVYVLQDKLYDAAALLDEVKNPRLIPEIAAIRPPVPQLNYSPGIYEELITIELTIPENCLVYISYNGEIPSIKDSLYDGPVTLQPGITQIRAITVNADGIVSNWLEAEYTLENIIFPIEPADNSIEELIRAALNEPDSMLMSDVLSSVTALIDATVKQYTTLEDLINLPSLRTLKLCGSNTPVDLKPLLSLTSLETLCLDSFAIDSVDLEIIGQMTWLKHLELPNNTISNIQSLSEMTALEELKLQGNSIMDISALSGLANLRALVLSQNAIEDISVLSSIPSLIELDLTENRLLNLNGLNGDIEVLTIEHNFVEDISAIAGCKKLRVFNAGNNRINSLSALSQLTALQELRLNNNQIGSIELLSLLTALKYLDISTNAIDSLESLQNCLALVELEANNNLINDLSSLKGLPSLESLNVENNMLTTITVLTECPKLKIVMAVGNPITDDPADFSGTGITVYRN